MRNLLILSFIISTIGCGAIKSTSYSKYALLSKVNGNCLMSIESIRPDMAHGPITLLVSGTHKLTAKFHLPKIKSVILANELQVKYLWESGESQDVRAHEGELTFTQQKVSVNLYFVDQERKEAIFNGNYIIKGNCS